MHQEIPVLTNIAIALGYALIGGALAKLVRLPPIVGCLLAGVAVGPFTPGFVGDQHAIQNLAELGVGTPPQLESARALARPAGGSPLDSRPRRARSCCDTLRPIGLPGWRPQAAHELT